MILTAVLLSIAGTLGDIQTYKIESPSVVLADEQTATNEAQNQVAGEEEQIEYVISYFNPDLDYNHVTLLAHAIYQYSSEKNIDWKWIAAIVWQECSFNPYPDCKGYYGPMQVSRHVGRCYGVDNLDELNDPDTNISVGVAYLSDLIDSYCGDVRKATLAYNSGPTQVSRGSANYGYLHSVQRVYRQIGVILEEGSNDDSF